MKEAQESEFLKIIINTLKGFKISIIGKDCRYRMVNKGYTEAFGLSEEEIVGKKVSEIMGEDVFEKIIKPNLERAFKGEDVHYSEWFYFPEKGKRYCEVSYHPLKDEKRGISHVIVVSHDITSIKESEEKYRRLFENVPAGVYVSTPEGRILDFNEQLLKILGYPDRETLLNTNAQDLYIEPQRRKVWMEKMEKEDSVGGYEQPLKRFDGSTVWVMESARAVRDPEGKIIRFEGVIEDITERKGAEERIKKQIVHIELINKITKDIIEHVEIEEIIDSIFEHLFKNISLEYGIFFLYNGERDGLDILKTFPENPLYEKVFKELGKIPLKETGLRRCIEGEVVYKEDFLTGNVPYHRWIAEAGLTSGIAIPIIVENKLFGILTFWRKEKFDENEISLFKDLGEHVSLAVSHAKIYKELEKSYIELRKSQAMKIHEERLKVLGQIASGIAHDINNLLSPILGYTELALQRPHLDKKLREWLQIIKSATEQISFTVSRLKEFYRKEEEKEGVVDIEKVLDEVIELTRPRWKDIPQRKGITVNIKKEVIPIPPFSGVKSYFRDALVNLIINSVDALPNGGDIILRAKTFDGKLILEVSDNGIGMDEETKKRCLEPFFTLKKEGTGLGLSIVHEMVKRCNGEIEIESSIGKGTTVRLIFPVKEVKEKIEEKKLPEKIPPLSILVVDDDEMVREFIKEFLEEEGHKVKLAENGISAERILSSSHKERLFDLVITDLGMPGMDGITLAKIVKSKSPSTPVILLTGWSTVMEEGEGKFIDQILTKPIDIERFKEMLKSIYQCMEKK